MNILSNVIVDLLGYNNPEEREIYKYGVQILLSDLSNFLIIIVRKRQII
ncbi:accessory gene regulator B family protein [uncultured Catenibacterium sp.]